MVAIPVAQRFAPLIDEQVRIKKLEREQVVRLRYEINYAGRKLTDDLAKKLCRVALVNGHDAVLIGDERCEALRDFRAAAQAVAAFNGLTFDDQTDQPAGDDPQAMDLVIEYDEQPAGDEPQDLETDQPASDEPHELEEPQDDQATSDEPQDPETEQPAGDEPQELQAAGDKP